MINIKIPDNNIPEREYIIDIIFNEFLGLKYSLQLDDSLTNYIINFDENTIIIEDSFFKHFKAPLSYLSKSALPDVQWVNNFGFLEETDIPILYGNDKISYLNNSITCGIDIFASSYFMLTRWEESVIDNRDIHNRFPALKSTAYESDFLHRPIVNEYIELLWNMLKELGYKGHRKKKTFNLKLTHDVDFIYNPYRNLMGDLVKRRKPFLFLEKFTHLIKKGTYNPFNFLMNISEDNNTKSYFYFMSTNSGLPHDTDYYLNTNIFHKRLSEIRERGHSVGFHPGYYTYDNPQIWGSEKERLEQVLQEEVTEGRQHYLKMDINKTLSIWENNNMKTDLTLGYADKEGFRCGTGDSFSVFDFLTRKKYRLKEQPLIIMDSTLQLYQNYNTKQAKSVVKNLINTGKKYNTTITLLFHPLVFFDIWDGYDDVYKSIFL